MGPLWRVQFRGLPGIFDHPHQPSSKLHLAFGGIWSTKLTGLVQIYLGRVARNLRQLRRYGTQNRYFKQSDECSIDAPQASSSSSPSAQSFVKSQIRVLFKQEPFLHRNLSRVQTESSGVDSGEISDNYGSIYYYYYFFFFHCNLFQFVIAIVARQSRYKPNLHFASKTVTLGNNWIKFHFTFYSHMNGENINANLNVK